MAPRPFCFWKYEGIGNDFVIVDARTAPIAIDAPLAIRMCDRRRGIGADGVLIIGPPPAAPALADMRILNADGSEPEMCGNGIRCVAKHLGDADPTLADVGIATLSGLKRCRIDRDILGHVTNVEVDMGLADFDRSSAGMTGRGSFDEEPILDVHGAARFSAVSMGNPHLVTFSALSDEEIERLGPRLENHRLFSHRINVGFAAITGLASMRLRVWERGCGFTLGCGTGACAAAAVACKTGRMPYGTPIVVSLPGGDLVITVPAEDRPILLKGPATRVFEGTWTLD